LLGLSVPLLGTVPFSFCKLCRLEHDEAMRFLPVELSDRRERMLYKIGQVLVDVARQNEEILTTIKKG